MTRGRVLSLCLELFLFLNGKFQKTKKELKMLFDVKGVERKEKNGIMGNVIDFTTLSLKIVEKEK